MLDSLCFRRARFQSCCAPLILGLTGLLLSASPSQAQESDAIHSAPARLTSPIDDHNLIPLKGNVLGILTPDRDLGPVEDSTPVHLVLLLQRTPEQQADLDNLIARQQQKSAPEYHKWLTPKEFGARFGAHPDDIAKLSQWLESHGMQVRSVLNNASMISFTASSAQVRNNFHAQLHYFNINGARRIVTTQEPQIPAALAPVVAAIRGLNNIPKQSKRTEGHPVAYDSKTHRFHRVDQSSGLSPEFSNSNDGSLDETPQDFYIIYNANPIYNDGNLGYGATIGIPEPTDMEYGALTGKQAAGGDVATFRKLFGVAGTLNMTVAHGAGAITCGDPGINGDVGEAALDAEWANAVAPSARVVFMSCDTNGPTGDGFEDALSALIDNNISDVITSSYGSSEIYIDSSQYTFQDTLLSQAATQGQTFIDAAGDAGSADADQDATGTAVTGLSVDNYAGPPLTTDVGGLDFSDKYDADLGGPPQTNYWSATNSATYENALGYLPETPWNQSCADSIVANDTGGRVSPATYCGTLGAGSDGSIVGGGGGFSSHYAQPAFQTGILGLASSATKRAVPDVALFASNGIWGHAIIECDSSSPATACTSTSTFEEAGGTSFAAPQFAGVVALLVVHTGERQGTVNPALYALAKAQYTAGTACYSNGQTNNIGITTSLPASTCIFHDVTTGNNDEACQSGSPSCYTLSGQTYGLLSSTGTSSLTIAYPAGVGYDEASGLGSINIANLIGMWNSAFTSSVALTASELNPYSDWPETLTATVTGSAPTGYTGTPPALLGGTVTFYNGSAPLGSCKLSSGSCSLPIGVYFLNNGPNPITATFAGNMTYPAATSQVVTITTIAGTGWIPANMVFPVSGPPMAGPTQEFIWWFTGSGTPSGYWLFVGTTGWGSKDLYDSGEITTNSTTVHNLPVNGERVYATVFTMLNGTLYHNYFSYFAATQASLGNPTPGTTIFGPTVTFNWNGATGSNIDGYWLFLGTTGPGSKNLYDSGQTTALTKTVNGLSTNGTIYARLYTSYNGQLVYNDYTYTVVPQQPAQLTTPTPGTMVAGPSVTFDWSAASGQNVEGYWLFLGTTGVGSKNLYDSGETTALTETVSGLPTSGTIYARVYTSFNGKLAYNDYTYTAAPQQPAQLTTPTPGTVLSGPTVTFAWNAPGVSNVSGYWLFLGTAVGSKNLYDSGEITATSATVSRLPTNGETIYARVYTSYNGKLVYNDYTFTAANQAQLTTPTPGSTLSGTTVAFDWSAATGSNIQGYWLFVGTTGVGSKNIYDSGETTALTETVSGLPTSGTIYARVYTSYNGTLVYQDYTYTAQ